MIWFSNIFSSRRLYARHMKVGNETYFWNWLIAYENTLRTRTLSFSLSFYMIYIFNRACAHLCVVYGMFFTHFCYWILHSISNHIFPDQYWFSLDTFHLLIRQYREFEYFHNCIQSNNKWSIFVAMMILILNENIGSFH